MNVMVNNQETLVTPGILVPSLLDKLEIAPNGIAVAINNRVIPKSEWASTSLIPDDTITIIQATQGG